MEKNILLVTLDADDNGDIIGLARIDEPPAWRNEAIHSSNPELPLNDRKPRFVTVAAVYPTTTRDDLWVAEVLKKAYIAEGRLPMMRVLGHDVEAVWNGGTGSGPETHHVGPFYEVRVGGETIGSVDGQSRDIQEIGRKAMTLAEQYISRKTEEKKHAF